MRPVGWVRIEIVDGEAECEVCRRFQKGRFIRGESKFSDKPSGRQTMCLPCAREVVGRLLEELLKPPLPPGMLHPERN